VHIVYSIILHSVMCLLYIWCCVYILYVVLGIDGVMYMLDMWCCVHIYSVDDGYMVFYAFVVVRMLDMWRCVHMVLCTCCICSVIYI